MLAANFADYLTTIYALNKGFVEANPFLSLAIQANKFSLVKLSIPVLLTIYSISRINSPKSLERVCKLMTFASLLFASVAVHNLVKVLLN